jgi:purine nucleosidase
MRRPVILDLDTGIDDSVALALAVHDLQIQLLGVVASYGNVTVENSVYNTRHMLDLFGATEIPVYCGLSHSLSSERFDRSVVSARIHGQDGLGDIGMSVDRSYPVNRQWEPFLWEAIHTYAQDLVIVTTGPLTNLAWFLQQHPEVGVHLGLVVCMGGAALFPGNVTPWAEANISQDPLAAKIVMESGAPVVLVPLDVTEKSRITRAMTDRWAACGRPGRKELARMVSYYIDQHPGKTECYVHDPSAVTYVTHPEFFAALSRPLTVLTDGPERGRVVGDLSRIRTQGSTRVCLDVHDMELVSTLNAVLVGG